MAFWEAVSSGAAVSVPYAELQLLLLDDAEFGGGPVEVGVIGQSCGLLLLRLFVVVFYAFVFFLLSFFSSDFF